jgi:internalin A
MMDKYDISYRTEGSGGGVLSLVVERLQWNPPAYDALWAEAAEQPDIHEIRVIYRLNTMPPGIPTWFIARSHRFSIDLHWRTGALLRYDDGRHLALVRADRHRNRLVLAVRGPSPAGFFSILDDGLNLTLQRFPGLNIVRQVPCPCRDRGTEPCAELFDYEDLRSRLARKPPRHEIECRKSGEMVSVLQLLHGFAPAERDLVRMDISQLAKMVSNKLDEQGDYVQRMFLKLQRQIQTQQKVLCPSVFSIVPTDRRKFTGSVYRLHLYCEEPGSWHRLPEPAGTYEVIQPAEWFRKLGPHLEYLIAAFKTVAPLIGPVLGIAVDKLDSQIKADCDLMKELAERLPRTLAHEEGMGEPTRRDPGPTARAVDEADFRAIKAMLTKLDPDESWGGLSRTTTPEGLTLYLCSHHAEKYRRSL